MRYHEALSSLAPWGADVPSLCTFLEILLGNSLEYNSDDIGYYAPPRMRYYTNDEVSTGKVTKLTPPDQSPYSPIGYPREEGGLL
jgi:hypothetical protein